jgi:hypothetical protein
MLTRRKRLALPLILLLAGCGTQAAPRHSQVQSTAARPALGTEFEPGRTGTIGGQVIWRGPLPESHSFRDAKVLTPELAKQIDPNNPLVPKVHPESNGIAGAVVFLRKVEASRSRPWDLPPLRVAMKDRQIVIDQGGKSTFVAGFVLSGDTVEMNSHSSEVEMLRARGAAFFTLAFPEPEKPLRRVLDTPGLVELSSAAGHYWARSFIFVAEHPYFARTDAAGKFQIDNVPDGDYELVCWMPNWKTDRFERDPEVQTIARLWFMPPMEKSATISVRQGQITDVHLEICDLDFEKKKQK